MTFNFLLFLSADFFKMLTLCLSCSVKVKLDDDVNSKIFDNVNFKFASGHNCTYFIFPIGYKLN